MSCRFLFFHLSDKRTRSIAVVINIGLVKQKAIILLSVIGLEHVARSRVIPKECFFIDPSSITISKGVMYVGQTKTCCHSERIERKKVSRRDVAASSSAIHCMKTHETMGLICKHASIRSLPDLMYALNIAFVIFIYLSPEVLNPCVELSCFALSPIHRREWQLPFMHTAVLKLVV